MTSDSLPTLPVRVSSGILRGSVALDGSHLRYTGIPYATALRFQAPKAAPKWNGTFDAVNENRKCPQNTKNALITEDEDCLYLNVYTPLKSENKLYPVMVFIHGGGFKEGSGSPHIYGPDHLVKHNIILVTINYRLGVLGFLCLGIKEAAGNMGLKDQAEALRWVKNNIRAFGGDPDNITLFGESAGAASVLYHMLSPMSAGLFNRAIMESGSAMSFSSGQFEAKEMAFKLAAQMGHNTRDVYEIVNIFKQKSIVELLSAKLPRITGNIIESDNIFVPCIEETIEGSEPFITASPYEIINSGKFNKVPIIMGFNNAEGYMFVAEETSRQIDEFNFVSALPRDLIFSVSSKKELIAARFKEQYQDGSQMNVHSLAKYEGDAGIKYPVIATVDLLLKNMKEPVYVYKFAYGGLLNQLKFCSGFITYPGATHTDELPYIFKPEGTTLLTLFEMKTIDKMTLMWTNFAKYGDPTPQETALVPMMWQPANPSDPQLLVIDRQFSTESLWSDKDILLWNDTYTYYRRTS
ncbi:cholinesterase 1-like [Zerene cesonia]|uniref:cholinesterase 1-like n=1 Tax=Zerene cesonia TaxID=33412 RepID=UPI0018E4FD97|nr:cholinesterase 1-like [Zerene cesonia]